MLIRQRHFPEDISSECVVSNLEMVYSVEFQEIQFLIFSFMHKSIYSFIQAAFIKCLLTTCQAHITCQLPHVLFI